MIEKAIDKLQQVLKKITKDFSKWLQNVPRAVFEVNNREIIHLLHSPAQILLEFEPTRAMARKYPEYKRQTLTAAINSQDILPGEDELFNQLLVSCCDDMS